MTRVDVVATARVDLWLGFESDASAALLRAYGDWLDEEELGRWQRFRREEDARLYLLAHGLLRGVLATYTGCEPGALAFESNAWGKPALRASPGCDAVHFNLSHTRGLVVLAVCADAEVGVDVEGVDPGIDATALAAGHFSVREQALLRTEAGLRRAERFTEIWALKEAWLKATGRGLSVALDSFSAIPDREGPCIVEHGIGGDCPASCACGLYAPETGYRLAIAVRAPAADALEVRTWAGLPLSGFTPFELPAGPTGAGEDTGNPSAHTRNLQIDAIDLWLLK